SRNGRHPCRRVFIAGADRHPAGNIHRRGGAPFRSLVQAILRPVGSRPSLAPRRRQRPSSSQTTTSSPASLRAIFMLAPSGRRSVNRQLTLLNGTTRTAALRVHLLTSATRKVVRELAISVEVVCASL